MNDIACYAANEELLDAGTARSRSAAGPAGLAYYRPVGEQPDRRIWRHSQVHGSSMGIR